MDEDLRGLRFYDLRDHLAYDVHHGLAPQHFEGMLEHVHERGSVTRSQAFDVVEKFVSDLRREIVRIRRRREHMREIIAGRAQGELTNVRVLVCCGREFTDRDRLFAALDDLHARQPIGEIINGAVRGADTFAGEWARSHGVPEFSLPADREDSKSGPERNTRMLTEGRPDLIVAFPGKRGTADMVAWATAAGVPVLALRAEPAS